MTKRSARRKRYKETSVEDRPVSSFPVWLDVRERETRSLSALEKQARPPFNNVRLSKPVYALTATVSAMMAVYSTIGLLSALVTGTMSEYSRYSAFTKVTFTLRESPFLFVTLICVNLAVLYILVRLAIECFHALFSSRTNEQ
ncbi:hypothetical protein [Agrobacterium sp. NPDC089420]|uniref:hypothetical protein n=1 Tax=Agrobacterium sp. NPDC089420 TaxID=3363918 RepID=UPI00384AE3ED